jgi:hypothetical protein
VGLRGVGAYAWLQRPDNRTGPLMTLTGVGVAVSGLQLLQVPVLFTLGALVDTVIVAVLIQLLLGSRRAGSRVVPRAGRSPPRTSRARCSSRC